jgi:hypothetical protein
VTAGLKQARDSTDLVVASQSQSVLLYTHDRDADRIERTVRFLQGQPWADVIFTRGGHDGQGGVSGTFSFDLMHAAHPSRSADVIFSLPWTSAPNAFGAAGSQTIHGTTGGPIQTGASGHGGLSPWVVHNTFVAWGPDVKARIRIDLPVSLADVVPTVLTLNGITPTGGADRGRVLRELLKSGPAPASIKTSHRTVATSAGGYRAAVEISTADGHDYLDRGSRLPISSAIAPK